MTGRLCRNTTVVTPSSEPGPDPGSQRRPGGPQTGEQAWAEGRSEGKRLRPKFYTYVRTRRHKDNLGTSTGMHSMHLENKLHSGIIHRLKRKKKLGASVTRRNLEPSYIALLVHDRGHKAKFRKKRILYS